MAFQPASFSLENLASWTGNAQPGSINHTAGMAEFTFRQTKAQLEASNAQIAAAKAEEMAAGAAIEAATHAGRNAKYMLWSVIFAAASAFISLISTILTNWPKH